MEISKIREHENQKRTSLETESDRYYKTNDPGLRSHKYSRTDSKKTTLRSRDNELDDDSDGSTKRIPKLCRGS